MRGDGRVGALRCSYSCLLRSCLATLPPGGAALSFLDEIEGTGCQGATDEKAMRNVGGTEDGNLVVLSALVTKAFLDVARVFTVPWPGVV